MDDTNASQQLAYPYQSGRQLLFTGELVAQAESTEPHTGSTTKMFLYKTPSGRYVFATEYRNSNTKGEWRRGQARVIDDPMELADSLTQNVKEFFRALSDATGDRRYADLTRESLTEVTSDATVFGTSRGPDIVFQGDLLVWCKGEPERYSKTVNYHRIDKLVDGSYLVSFWYGPAAEAGPDDPQLYLATYSRARTPAEVARDLLIGRRDRDAAMKELFTQRTQYLVTPEVQESLEAAAQRDESFVPVAYVVEGEGDPLLSQFQRDRAVYEQYQPAPEPDSEPAVASPTTPTGTARKVLLAALNSDGDMPLSQVVAAAAVVIGGMTTEN